MAGMDTFARAMNSMLEGMKVNTRELTEECVSWKNLSKEYAARISKFEEERVELTRVHHVLRRQMNKEYTELKRNYVEENEVCRKRVRVCEEEMEEMKKRLKAAENTNMSYVTVIKLAQEQLDNVCKENRGHLDEKKNKEKASEKSSLNCCICYEDDIETWVALKCGHVFCEKCVETMSNHGGLAGKCPTCKNVVITAEGRYKYTKLYI